MRVRMRLILAVFFLLNFFAPTRVHAQATGQLTGTVSDASQAAVPGAEVTATGIGTGLERKTTTNQQGDYTFLFCSPANTACASRKKDSARYRVTFVSK